MSSLTAPARIPRSDLPTNVTVWEVGPRDGLQNESTIISTSIKVELIERLASCGLPVVEATSFVRPDRVPQLADAAEVMQAITRNSATRYPVLVPNERGLTRAMSCGVDEIAVFASATESFAQRNLGRSLADQMSMFRPTIAAATAAGLRVRGYVSMVCGDPWEGTVHADQVVSVCSQLIAAGCDSISLGDTIGVGTAGQVSDLIDRLAHAGIPLARLGVHCHDTYGQALANTLSALASGITTVDSSLGGLGGCPYAESATGNLATEDLVWMLQGLGIETGVDLDRLIATSWWLARAMGRPPRSAVATAYRPRPTS